MKIMRYVAIFVCVLSACAQFPDLDETVNAHAETSEFPDLIPFETILSETSPDKITSEVASADVRARAARLRARAAQLRGPIVDANTRTRMQSGVTQP